MKLTVNKPNFKCPENMVPHLQKVFDGEYDVPLEGSFSILDVGANCGAFTAWAYHRWPGSIFHCYEPHPVNFNFLKENLAEIRNGSWTLNNMALGKDSETRVLYNGKNNGGEHSLLASCQGVSDTGMHVQVLDAAQAPTTNIVKIDTEGCEVEILERIFNGHRRPLPRAVLLEYHCDIHRRQIDTILKDYFLYEVHSYENGRGVLKYLHKEYL